MFCCPLGNFVFKKFCAVFKLMVKLSPHPIYFVYIISIIWEDFFIIFCDSALKWSLVGFCFNFFYFLFDVLSASTNTLFEFFAVPIVFFICCLRGLLCFVNSTSSTIFRRPFLKSWKSAKFGVGFAEGNPNVLFFLHLGIEFEIGFQLHFWKTLLY